MEAATEAAREQCAAQLGHFFRDEFFPAVDGLVRAADEYACLLRAREAELGRAET